MTTGVLGGCNTWSEILKLFKIVKGSRFVLEVEGTMRANMALVDVTPQTEVGLNSAFAASYG